MDNIYQHLLECDERPFTSEAQLDSLKKLLAAAKLSPAPHIDFDYTSCQDKVNPSELTTNLKKFKGVLEIEEKSPTALSIVFNSLLSAANFVKFFTLANQVEFNPYAFNLTFIAAPEPAKALQERKDKASANVGTSTTVNGAKKPKKKPANSSTKFTARFYFYIESSPDFELSKKIIGKKGKNMKIILTECEKVFRDEKVPRDFLKLRLRGKGSSYKEGATNKESDEDLHLCLSAKNGEVLSKAIELIESLLEGIFKEYNVFCKRQGLKTVKRLYRLISDLTK